ncbi:DUF4149 domain-containing protein [uncultured Tateyamaria sp.]|uniref:DUF4149 domain-containing protein n=1 Tax=Tateyamaria sp. 1078 TaxID=3417464 RepID=UPI002639E17F|nr:DUF4149 domain-containing protein [uncultured Tateyamaria sp.]
MASLSLLLAATLLGGMVFFSFGFAPVLFRQLPMEQVRPLLRGTFPYYYLVVIVLSALAAGVAASQSGLVAALLGLICFGTVYARQVLMGHINAATDRGDQKAFHRLHMVSVVIQLVQIGLCGWAVVLLG